MKTFKQLFEKKIQGTQVFKKRIGKYQMLIQKDKNEFIVYIDNEKLDTYNSQKEAEKMGMEFIKQIKG